MKYDVVKFLKLMYYQWKYRHIDPDVCCCGGYVSQGGYGCIASCRSEKEYVISELVYNNKNKKVKNGNVHCKK